MHGSELITIWDCVSASGMVNIPLADARMILVQEANIMKIDWSVQQADDPKGLRVVQELHRTRSPLKEYQVKTINPS